jgi:hypothetical protein
MAFTIAPSMAADVGGLNVAGYVDTILAFSSADKDVAIGGEDDDTIIEFSAAAQLEVGYQIGDAVSANMEIYFTEDDGDSDTNEVELQQAYVSWAVSEQVSLVMGKFHNWIGWEGLDAPELYRVNNSYMYAGGYQAGNDPVWSGGYLNIWGDDVTGLGAIITPSEQIEIGIFAVNYIFYDGDLGATLTPPVTPAEPRSTDSLSFGAYVTYTMDGVGYFDFDLSLGIDETQDDSASAASIFQIDLNGEIDMLREDNGLLFAYDINYTDYDLAAAMGILLLANYALPTETPMSLTASINYFDPVDDDDVAEDDEGMEFAVALLANPTDDENFSTNLELQYISRSGDDLNELVIFVEALAVIP